MGPFAFCPDRAAWLPEWSSEVAREQKLLSEQSAAILELIAAGHSYEQILARLPDLTYPDIFASAREALDLLTSQGPKPLDFVERARQEHKRAYAKWSPDEDARLERLLQAGMPPVEIAQQLQRQKGAITSRIVKLGLEGKPREPAAQPSAAPAAGAPPEARVVVPGWDRIRQRLDQEPSAGV